MNFAFKKLDFTIKKFDFLIKVIENKSFLIHDYKSATIL